jgi:hypothetical protein
MNSNKSKIVLKTAIILLVLVVQICFAQQSSTDSNIKTKEQKPEAYLRFDISNSNTPYIEVNMKAERQGSENGIRASLRDMDKKKLVTALTIASPNGNKRFRIPLNKIPVQDIIRQNSNYKIFVDTYPTANGNLDSEIEVATDVKVVIENKPVPCVDDYVNYYILAQLVEHTDKVDRQYAEERYNDVRRFLLNPRVGQSLQVKITPEDSQSIVSKPKSTTPRVNNDSIILCTEIVSKLPAKTFNFEYQFSDSAPFELRQKPLLLEKLKGAGESSSPVKPDEKGDVGKRSYVKNLDLAVVLTSSVADEEQADGSTVRKRKTQGTLDLRLVPLLNVKKVNPNDFRPGGIVQLWTPFYLDAKVSTGKITKDTLSINTIALGTQYELRHYLRFKDGYADLLRYQFSLNNISDRDFKQAEYNLGFEFQPIFGRINRPLGSEKDLFGKIIVETKNTFGYSVIPVFGVQWGRTYRVREPQASMDISRNIRRVYLGGDFSFNVTKRLKFTISDKLYLRGETSPNDVKNYFSGTIEAPIGEIGRDTTHGLFFSIEKGNKPPFSNPDVNVLKFGYRIVSNPGWLDRFR